MSTAQQRCHDDGSRNRGRATCGRVARVGRAYRPGAPPTPEQLARLAELDAGADDYLRTTRNTNTARAYARDWALWSEFCDALAIPEVRATRGSLTAFVRFRWLAGHAPTSIQRSLAGIAHGHTERGVQIDRTATRHARDVLNAEVRTEAEQGLPPRDRGKAPTITLEQLRWIIAACPDDTAGLRDRALLLVGIGIAARSGELAGLLARNVQDVGTALRVTTLFGKRGGRSVVVSAGENPLTDPVQAWRDWAAVAHLAPDGPAFRQVDQWGNLGNGLGARGCRQRVTACGDRAGVYGLKGHSLRVALVTAARSADKPKPIEVIADQGGWARDSSALLGYIRIVDKLVENATIGIGL